MSFCVYTDETDLDTDALNSALDKSVKADCPIAVEVVFVSAEEIQRLNTTTRGIDKVTDVLSYPTLDGIRGKRLRKKCYANELDENGNLIIGSVAVCMERAKEQAQEYGHSLKRELYYLIVHGVMHCLGYDHITDKDKAQMRKKEEQALARMGITRE